MKAFANRSWFQARLACLILAASAVAGYGQTPIIYSFESL